MMHGDGSATVCAHAETERPQDMAIRKEHGHCAKRWPTTSGNRGQFAVRPGR
jgi:hypothetical protein